MRVLPLVVFTNGEKLVIGEVDIPSELEFDTQVDARIDLEFLKYSSEVKERITPTEVFIDVSRS